MMAVAGILHIDATTDLNWWEVGTMDFNIDIKTLIIIQALVMSAFEAANFANFKAGKGMGLLGSSPFDPMGMKDTDRELKEIKNGRLAMVAFVGFCSVAAVRGVGPIDALKMHIADPYANNIFTSAVALEATIGVVALSIIPMIINAFGTLGSDDEEFRPIPW